MDAPHSASSRKKEEEDNDSGQLEDCARQRRAEGDLKESLAQLWTQAREISFIHGSVPLTQLERPFAK